MILADTSIWIDHFRFGNPTLQSHLLENGICIHPMVTGELACGSLKNRIEVLHRLNALPSVPVAMHEEALVLLESNALWKHGVGWIDVHLLASARLAHTSLWTLDKRLAKVASILNINGL